MIVAGEFFSENSPEQFCSPAVLSKVRSLYRFTAGVFIKVN